MNGKQAKLSRKLAKAVLLREGINPDKIPYTRYTEKVTHKRGIGLNAKGEEIEISVPKITRTLNKACLKAQNKLSKRRLRKFLSMGFRSTSLIRAHLSNAV